MTKNRKLKINEKIRNWYLFQAVYSTNGKFNLALNRIYDKWDLPLKSDDLTSCLQEFQKKYGRTDLKKLIGDIYSIILNFDLGAHWLKPLLFRVLSGKEEVPDYSFSISEGLKEKRVTMEIGPHTTLEDIKNSWPEIEKIKKTVWPNIKTVKTSLKTIENYIVWRQDLSLRYAPENLAPRKEFDGATETEEKIKLRDQDIVGIIWSDEKDISRVADKKRVDKLRQIRKRGEKLLKQ